MKNKKQKFFALLFALFFSSSPLFAKSSINDVLFKIEPTIVTLYAYGDNNFSIKREDLIQKSFGKIQVDHFLNGYTDQLTDPTDKFDEEKLAKIKNYLGTGFIIDASGYILTNYSIIKTDSKIKAIIEGKEYDVDTVGEDRKTNLCS
jgi:S1-C subfamily serine protease